MVISNSDRGMFKSCPRKWDLGSPNRQNLRSRKKAKPLWLGTLVHLCLEKFYSGEYPTALAAFMAEGKNIPKVEREIFADEIFLAGNMLRHYSLVYPSLLFEPFTVLAVELGFQVPLNDEGDILAGTIDGVVRYKDTGALGCLEHKTFALHKNEELHDIDDQTALYPAALNHLISEGLVPGVAKHEFCEIVLYNGLWKKIPGGGTGELKVNKDGKLSKTALTTMTPHWLGFSRKLLENEVEIPVDKNQEMEDTLLKFFPRREIHRGRQEQDLALKRLLAEFKKMKEANELPFDHPELYHNPTNECIWKCPFIPLCGALNCGGDKEAIIKGAYEIAPSRGEYYEK